MKLMELNEMIRADAEWLRHNIDALKKKREKIVQAKGDTSFADGLLTKLEKALKAAEVASESLKEGKTKRTKLPKAPRMKVLHDIMAGRKAGGHYTEKTDYKRAKEKQKHHKEMKDQA